MGRTSLDEAGNHSSELSREGAVAHRSLIGYDFLILQFRRLEAALRADREGQGRKWEATAQQVLAPWRLNSGHPERWPGPPSLPGQAGGVLT